MATVIVHDVDEGALERLRESLTKTGSSVEAEVRSMIERRANAVGDERSRQAHEATAALREHRARMHDKYGSSVNLTEMVAQDRAEG